MNQKQEEGERVVRINYLSIYYLYDLTTAETLRTMRPMTYGRSLTRPMTNQLHICTLRSQGNQLIYIYVLSILKYKKELDCPATMLP